MIRYQDEPETALPAHVVLQLEPDTPTATVTLLSTGMVSFDTALVDALVRTLVRQAAYLVNGGGVYDLNSPAAP